MKIAAVESHTFASQDPWFIFQKKKREEHNIGAYAYKQINHDKVGWRWRRKEKKNHVIDWKLRWAKGFYFGGALGSTEPEVGFVPQVCRTLVMYLATVFCVSASGWPDIQY